MSTVLLRVLAAAALAALLIGCAKQAPPPARIATWQEPTATAEASSSEGEDESDEASGTRVSAAEERKLTEQVELVGVATAANEGYIVVRFKAPSKLAQRFQPGRLYVVDEATGVRYDEVPLMPKLGFLLGRPVRDGQIGYVMLVNRNDGIKPGSKVTVVLRGFRKEHVVVE